MKDLEEKILKYLTDKAVSMPERWRVFEATPGLSDSKEVSYAYTPVSAKVCFHIFRPSGKSGKFKLCAQVFGSEEYHESWDIPSKELERICDLLEEHRKKVRDKEVDNILEDVLKELD